jgi:peptidoglycan hydrolase FlgJ
MSINGIGPGVVRSAEQDEASLRKTAKQLEGVFVQQLFKAMRETVDTNGGIAPSGGGEAMFRDLLDQHVAERVPEEWDVQHSLAEKLYQQLRTRLAQSDDSSATEQTTTGSTTTPVKEKR